MEEEEKDPRNFMFGTDTGLAKKPLVEDGQWDEYLPGDEIQRGKYFDTMGCVSFACLNTIETLAKRKWGADWNKSDRFTAKMSGTGRNGNHLSNVMWSVKNHGTVNENTWTWDRDKFSWNDFYRSIPADVKGVGKRWGKEYEAGYEFLHRHPNTYKEALRFSPIWCAGFAWYKKGDLYYNYGRANHSFIIYGYDWGNYWKVLDHYPPYRKKLHWSFLVSYPRLMVLKKANQDFDLQAIIALIKRGFKYIMRVEKHSGAKGQVYELSATQGLIERKQNELNNIVIRQLAEARDLTGISERDYYNLIN